VGDHKAQGPVRSEGVVQHPPDIARLEPAALGVEVQEQHPVLALHEGRDALEGGHVRRILEVEHGTGEVHLHPDDLVFAQSSLHLGHGVGPQEIHRDQCLHAGSPSCRLGGHVVVLGPHALLLFLDGQPQGRPELLVAVAVRLRHEQRTGQDLVSIHSSGEQTVGRQVDLVRARERDTERLPVGQQSRPQPWTWWSKRPSARGVGIGRSARHASRRGKIDRQRFIGAG
jgi:hypothetical protein